MGIAASAAASNSDAKNFLANQITMFRAISRAPYLVVWVIGLVLVWLAAFLWSAERENSALATPSVSDPRPISLTINHFYENVVVVWNKIAPAVFHIDLATSVSSVATVGVVAHRGEDRDTSLRAALAYAAFGDWSDRQLDQFESGDTDRYSDALSKFHQLAADGILRVWGLPVSYQATTVYQLIDKNHWGYAEIEYLDSLRDKPFTRSKVPKALTYTDLKVNRVEIEKEWPHITRIEANPRAVYLTLIATCAKRIGISIKYQPWLILNGVSRS
ncbi:hypothetical protein [Novosphingobium sp.]|uniref:hypothetical protein n=1 Tax=Novosphingobium sp. TaxID=1874826 RepID=UPI0025ED3AE8|nr:hypothetical protein [Novosphingobium sp.]